VDTHDHDETSPEPESVDQKMFENDISSHLKSRINAIQNRRGKGVPRKMRAESTTNTLTLNANGCSQHSPSLPSMEFDDAEMAEMKLKQNNNTIIGGTRKGRFESIPESITDEPYCSSWIYSILYVFSTLHFLVSVWFLVDLTVYSLRKTLPIVIRVLLYFNIAVFCAIEIWKITAAILFKLETLERMHCLRKWTMHRMQFWLCLPLLWICDKESYSFFKTLQPNSMEIWFDFCIHHLWMVLLCVLYTFYPVIFGNGAFEFEDIGADHLISSNVYLLSFIMQIPVMFVKVFAVIGTKS